MRRINPASQAAGFAVLLLLLFEMVFLTGLLELKVETVRQHAPWAYEYFLKLTSGHLESKPEAAILEEGTPKTKPHADSSIATVMGILTDNKTLEQEIADLDLPKVGMAIEEPEIEVSETEPEISAVSEESAEEETTEPTAKEKTVEEIVEEQIGNLPEIPPEPKPLLEETNVVPAEIKKEMPVG